MPKPTVNVIKRHSFERVGQRRVQLLLRARLWLGTKDEPVEVVGVARDGKYHSLTEAPRPHFDTPLMQEEFGTFATLHVRTRTGAAGLLTPVRRAVTALDLTLPVSGVRTLREELGRSIAAV